MTIDYFALNKLKSFMTIIGFDTLINVLKLPSYSLMLRDKTIGPIKRLPFYSKRTI
jgi:hypothetical protein